ncbi:BLUF domain-containing protein [Brevundimonas sp. BH3]|uniref:BLUF domain-containing protein n=1 Tax=Brevundimonas sp. BH3 TaxID=3133089 RepID=UPI003877EEB2
MVRQLIYTSRVANGFQEEDNLLQSILDVSVRNNATVSVTGMLLFYRDHFFQALEGSAEAVETIYLRVCRDPRHQELRLLQDAPRKSRSFEGWAMCGYNLGPADNEILGVLGLRRGFDPKSISGPGALALLTNVHAVQQRVNLRTPSSIVIES